MTNSTAERIDTIVAVVGWIAASVLFGGGALFAVFSLIATAVER